MDNLPPPFAAARLARAQRGCSTSCSSRRRAAAASSGVSSSGWTQATAWARSTAACSCPRAMTVTPEWLRHQTFLFGTSSLQAGKVDFREFALTCYQARSPRRPRTYCFCLPHPPSGQCRRARPVDGVVAFARLGTAGVNETVRLLKTTRGQFATLSREALARFTFDAYSHGAGRLGRDESEKMIEEVRRASLAVVG